MLRNKKTLQSMQRFEQEQQICLLLRKETNSEESKAL